MHLESKKFNSIKPGRLSSISVAGDLNHGIRAWKKLLKDSSIIEDCYNRKFYVKKSVRKRKQLELAKYNQSRER